LDMLFFLVLAVSCPYFVAAQEKTVNLVNNCPNDINVFINHVFTGGLTLPVKGEPGVIESDPEGPVLQLTITSNNGTLLGIKFDNGEYFIQKNTAFFDVGISVTPADTTPANGFCPTLTCDDVSCTNAFVFPATPTINDTVPTVAPAAPLFACPTSNIWNVTFCPSGVQPDPLSLPRTIQPHGTPGKCMDVRGNVQEDGTPVQVFDCNGSGAQQWVLTHGNTQVKLAGTNFCLDAGSSPANFVGMKIWQCFEGLPQQSWFYTDDERIAVTNMGLCLDVPNGNLTNEQQLQTFKCTDEDQNQEFTS